MKNIINIIKPIGVSSNDLLNYIHKDLKLNYIKLVEDLNEDIVGVILFLINKDNKKFKTTYSVYDIKFYLKNNISLDKEKFKRDFEINIKNIKISNIKKIELINLEQNIMSFHLTVKTGFSIEDFIFNIKNKIYEFKNFLSIERIMNCGLWINESITINDLWKYNKNIIFLNKLKDKIIPSTNLVIGEFDSIHKGHVKLLNKKNISILTFINNPSKNNQIYDINSKIKNLQIYNPKKIFIFDIKKENISAEVFIKKYLFKINPNKIFIGSDFKFGKNASGNIDLLKKNFNVSVIKKCDDYSTNKVKKNIIDNNFLEANCILEKEFFFESIIVKGKQLGRTLGFPTANIFIKTSFPFSEGSYYSEAIISYKKFYASSFIRRIDDETILVETYIFNFDKNIYGKIIKVIPIFFVRGLQKFNSKDELIKNINGDINFILKERKKYEK